MSRQTLSRQTLSRQTLSRQTLRRRRGAAAAPSLLSPHRAQIGCSDVAGARRILFFDAYPHAFSGAQGQMLLLMRGLADRGWDVTLTAPSEGAFPEQARAAGISFEVAELPASLSVYGRQTTGTKALTAAAALPAAWARLARWLRAKADIAHICDHRGQLLLGPAARLARMPAVWRIDSIDRNWALNGFCSRLAHHIVIPSRAAADSLPGLHVHGNLTVVPNNLPPGWVDAPPRHPSGPPTVVTVGRLHPDKGIDVLLRSMVLVRRQVPSARAVVVGGEQVGHELHRSELLDLRQRLELDDAVDFPGFLDHPQPVLLAASAYVQPSRERTELQPIAVLEAMAIGLPVVATRVGGVPEMLDGGRLGLLVPPDDPPALAAALARVLEDRRLGDELGRAAQLHVRAARSVDCTVDALEGVYASVLTRR